MARTLSIIDLGIAPYQSVWDLQKKLQKERIAGEIDDTLILVEHPPVFTIGKTGKRKDIVGDDLFFQRTGIEVIETDRGGQVTYHGPGQIVGYPILDLKKHQPNITWYMRQLEEVLIQTLADFHIVAGRIQQYTGVWVGEKKIASLGVRMSRFVTMHGFCLNVASNLSHYAGIVPCGISHLGVTSFQELITPAPTLAEVKTRVTFNFSQTFAFTSIKTVDFKALG